MAPYYSRYEPVQHLVGFTSRDLGIDNFYESERVLLWVSMVELIFFCVISSCVVA